MVASMLGIYPAQVLLMAVVLRLCGVPKDEVAKWALRRADKRLIEEAIRIARGLRDARRQDHLGS
jgi:hypothetical protein